jgi:hypothetical protein
VCTQNDVVNSVKSSLPRRIKMDDAVRLTNQIAYFAVTGRAEAASVQPARRSPAAIKRRLATAKKAIR